MASNTASVGKLKIFFEMIKFEHTLFALPFAYLGALLVNQRIPAGMDLLWITLAMVGARTAAMSLNRIIDRHIDAKNPRTATRALPQGMLSVMEVWVYVILSILLLLVSAAQLSELALKLFPVAVFALVFYPYTKRFTWACHLFLGAALALAPLGAWIAISGSFALSPILLGLGVLFWVAGFDIIYACDDYDFDKENNIHSIPAKFGINAALKISSLFHIIAPSLFLAVGLILNLGWFYFIGVITAVIILFYEHSLVKPHDLSKGGVAFFTMNGVLSMVMFVFSFLDIVF
ncbi:MAG: 4-hydroxybenzoate octaprenyltransferase [Firmicutes bacterium]|nr:4-hydroxybenzoate octaprenyltransferase [Bacillota bacterium]